MESDRKMLCFWHIINDIHHQQEKVIFLVTQNLKYTVWTVNEVLGG